MLDSLGEVLQKSSRIVGRLTCNADHVAAQQPGIDKCDKDAVRRSAADYDSSQDDCEGK